MRAKSPGGSPKQDQTPSHARREPAKRASGGRLKKSDDDADDEERARGGGIHIKPSHKGLLHKNLGVAAGKPISTEKLEKAKADASPAEKKRIVFAENARKWHH